MQRLAAAAAAGCGGALTATFHGAMRGLFGGCSNELLIALRGWRASFPAALNGVDAATRNAPANRLQGPPAARDAREALAVATLPSQTSSATLKPWLRRRRSAR